MRYPVARRLFQWCGVGLLALSAMPAAAQDVAWGKRSCPPPAAAPCVPATPLETAPAPAPAPEVPPPAPAAQEPSLSPEAFAATGGGESFAAASSAVGYIDPAIPWNTFRIRADAAYDDNRPDRADFFYARCGGANGPGPAGPAGAAASSVNYQEISAYMEYAPTQRMSGFLTVPYRMVDLTFFPPGVPAAPNQANYGFSDIDFGFKYAMLYSPTRVLTFQWRTYAPTGNASLGLGRRNWNLEPALLYYQQISKRFFLEGELRDFIPLPATQFSNAGNVIRYGIGASYFVYQKPKVRVAPVVEVVGWTVLSGMELVDGFTPAGPTNGLGQSSRGETIVNGKFGVRTFFGQQNRADIYVGYGRAFTGDVWYKDIIRLEARYRF